MSVNRRSSILASCFFANSRTVLASGIRGSLAESIRERTLWSSCRRAGCYNRVALSRPTSLLPVPSARQFDCFYSRDKCHLILRVHHPRERRDSTGCLCGTLCSLWLKVLFPATDHWPLHLWISTSLKPFSK